ncbi:MAG: triose-phosphate isomerase [Verrucomicrobia bacterium RIFCSPHIGHO2_12_FULL_41_10]|nr:MAG: triose-phosphate isomerase [Verrucomicrobia bacterium RIFCSPHIGHO2_12_FULL_41_10]HLB34200.1 triose-phosphate isomerase [Chthoniobacterales bacterium]
MPIPRKKIVAANWKMNMTSSEVAPYLNTFLLEIKNVEGVDIILIPPFTSLSKASELLARTSQVRLGAQNVSFQAKGAFTGEISATMLRDLFVRYVLIGHSERRRLFHETNKIVHQKLVMAHQSDLLPILCVGETLEEREAGKEKSVLERQITEAFTGLSHDEIADTIIAYEPVWAIGTGLTATVEQAQDAHSFIRKTVAMLSSPQIAEKIRLQYGGSVTPDNAHSLLSAPDIDGALVGGASLDPRAFAEIVKAALL